MSHKNTVKEGDIYEVIVVEGITFEIRYGYYEDYERERWGPDPVYPNFIKNPIYTDDGYPFVTKMQDPCEHYSMKSKKSGEEWCGNCIHLSDGGEIIGVCRCEKRRHSLSKRITSSSTYLKEKIL